MSDRQHADKLRNRRSVLLNGRVYTDGAGTVKSKLKGGHLGSWMATKGASLNAAENDFPIEI